MISFQRNFSGEILSYPRREPESRTAVEKCNRTSQFVFYSVRSAIHAPLFPGIFGRRRAERPEEDSVVIDSLLSLGTFTAVLLFVRRPAPLRARGLSVRPYFRVKYTSTLNGRPLIRGRVFSGACISENFDIDKIPLLYSGLRSAGQRIKSFAH